jgi:hypothetical protein
MPRSRQIARIVGPTLIAVGISEAINLDALAGNAAPVVYLNRQCGSDPSSPAAFSRGQNGLLTAGSGKLNLLQKTTFYDLRVSEFTSALSLVRRGTGTTFWRLRIEETDAMNCTNRLQHWDEQQPKHLSDIRRVGRGLSGHGVVLLAACSASAVVNQYGDLASHSAIRRTELSYPRNLGKHSRARIFFVLP